VNHRFLAGTERVVTKSFVKNLEHGEIENVEDGTFNIQPRNEDAGLKTSAPGNRLCRKFSFPLGKALGGLENPGMFSASKLTPEQKDALTQWAAAGATMSDLQKRLKEDFGHGLTYMDTRFLILDLGIELIEEPKAAPKKEEEKPAPVPTGAVTVTMDTLTLPGALVSGKATFSDGETAIWMLDQTGRPGLDPDTPGYRPTQEDILEFQKQLRALIQKSGL
jgi:hypothetical protein